MKLYGAVSCEAPRNLPKRATEYGAAGLARERVASVTHEPEHGPHCTNPGGTRSRQPPASEYRSVPAEWVESTLDAGGARHRPVACRSRWTNTGPHRNFCAAGNPGINNGPTELKQAAMGARGVSPPVAACQFDGECLGAVAHSRRSFLTLAFGKALRRAVEYTTHRHCLGGLRKKAAEPRRSDPSGVFVARLNGPPS